jgi:hypothetical protein
LHVNLVFWFLLIDKAFVFLLVYLYMLLRIYFPTADVCLFLLAFHLPIWARFVYFFFNMLNYYQWRAPNGSCLIITSRGLLFLIFGSWCLGFYSKCLPVVLVPNTFWKLLWELLLFPSWKIEVKINPKYTKKKTIGISLFIFGMYKFLFFLFCSVFFDLYELHLHKSAKNCKKFDVFSRHNIWNTHTVVIIFGSFDLL